MINELLVNGSYVDAAFLLLIIFSLISGIVALREMKKKVEATEKKIVALRKYQDDVTEKLDKRYESLKEVLVDSITKLTAKLNTILKGKETVVLEIDNKTNPLKALLDDTMDQAKATEDTLRKAILKNEEKMNKMRKEINDFSKEIEKMKDDIREHAIDLEL